MKKLLSLLFLSTILFACGSDDTPNSGGGDTKVTIATPEMEIPTNPIDAEKWGGDWNDSSNSNYKGYSYDPVVGMWILTQVNGKATDQFLVYQMGLLRGLKYTTKKPATGKAPDYESDLLRYTINNTQLKDSRGYIYNYTIAADGKSMSLYDGSNTYTFKEYDNNGIWYWKGDWNSKNDGHYDIYRGNYNPIEGTWQVMYENEKPSNEKMIYRFNRNFTVENPGNPKSLRKYEINDTAVKEASFGLTESYTYRYKIEGDSLYYENSISNFKETLVRYNK